MNERIKSLRKYLNMTQDDFSKQIGLSRNYIAQVEIGTKTPSERTISDICREFDVNEEWLRNGTGEMFVQKSKDEQISEMLGEIQKSGKIHLSTVLYPHWLTWTKMDGTLWKS